MDRFFTWLADLATRRAKWVILVTALVSAVAVIGASRVRANFHFRVFFDYPGNERVTELDRYNDEFGDDGGFAVVVIETNDVFTPPVLRYIQEISNKLKRKPQFRRILSLSLNTIPRGRGDEVVTGPLFERVPEDPATLRQIRETALASRLVAPRLVSKDGRYALVAAEFKKPLARITAAEAGEGNAAVREAMASTPVPPGARVVIGGTSISEEEAPKVMIRDQGVLMPVALGFIVVVMLLCFRTFYAVLMAFAQIGLTLLWTFGFMGFMGMSINIMSSSTPTILAVYGLLDSVFILSMFYRLYEAEGGHERGDRAHVREVMGKTIRRMGFPCLLTCATTAFGFASYATASLPLVRGYGYAVAFGVAVCYFSDILWMPTLFCLLPPPRKRRIREGAVSRLAVLGSEWLDRFTRRRSSAIIAVAVIVFAATIAVLPRGRASTVLLKELPKNLEGIEGINLVADHLLGVFSTGVMIAGKPGSMKDPKLLRALDQLDQWAEKQELVVTSISPSDLVREMHRAFNGGDPRFDTIPDDRGLISQYLALLDPPTRADFTTDDYSKTHLRIMCRDWGSSRWRKEVFEPLQQKVKELLPGYHVEFPGFMRAYDEASTLTVRELLWGFLQAFLAIALLVGIAFRSIRIAILSILPNLLPAMITMAVMISVGISLRATTMMFLSIAIGMVYDNTIFIFSSMFNGRARGLSHDEAMSQTFTVFGPPIMFSSALLVMGLGTFMVSSIPVLFTLGLTTAVTITLGAICDLVLTTSMIRKWGERLFVSKKVAASGPNRNGSPGGNDASTR